MASEVAIQVKAETCMAAQFKAEPMSCDANMAMT